MKIFNSVNKHLQNRYFHKTEFPLINSVLQKKQEGRIFNFDNFEFIIHKSGFSLLKLKNIDVKEILDFFADEPTLLKYFHIYNAPKEIVEAVKKDYRFGFKYRKRIQLRFNKQKINTNFRENLNTNYNFEIISSQNFDSLSVFGLNLDKHFWTSKDDFLKNAYGTVAINKETREPVSICYSSAIADNIAEIDIATLPDHRSKGLAKAVTECFIEQSLKKKIKPNWDCFEDNIPSLKTAQNTGFEKLMDYGFLSVYNKIK